MPPADTVGDDRHTDADTTLRILDSVERDGEQSQRAMASDAGIALGLANAYLRRCVRKGWVKMHEAPARRYLYYITPQGFAEKTRLTAEYLSSSFSMFRTARGECDALMADCEQRGIRTIALVGASDLAEIAALSALASNVEIAAIIDSQSNQSKLAGLPVVQSFDELKDIDALVITNIVQPQDTFDKLAKDWPVDRLFAPAILRISRGQTERPGEEQGS